MKINEVVELDLETEKKLDLRVRQVNNIINSVGDNREKLAVEVIEAIASAFGIRVQVLTDK